MADPIYGWHFVREDKRLGYGDGRKIRKGGTLTVDVEPVLCEAGLHASPKALDALAYAPGPIACFVRLGGTVVGPTDWHQDKMAATERTVIAYLDFRRVARDFIRDTLTYRQEPVAVLFEKAGLPEQAHAIRAIQMGTASFADIQTVFDAALAAAQAAAQAAARAAAQAAARAARAARAAARAAARDAARAAAGAAARDAARAAAGAAAWAAAWDDMNAMLEARLFSAMKITDPRKEND